MQIKDVAEICSITTTAILVLTAIVGGIWRFRIYRQQRRGLPRANLSQEVKAMKLNEKILIHISARILNKGDVMISLRSATARAYQIRPVDASIQEQLHKKEEEKLYEEEGKEISWPVLAIRDFDWEKKRVEIEPGEEDTFHFDLLIPADIEIVQVYTYFQNIAKRGCDTGWPTQGFYNVAKLLSGGGE